MRLKTTVTDNIFTGTDVHTYFDELPRELEIYKSVSNILDRISFIRKVSFHFICSDLNIFVFVFVFSPLNKQSIGKHCKGQTERAIFKDMANHGTQ